jgi:Holliday junction resolvasome RuvABC endonuclease subunit
MSIKQRIQFNATDNERGISCAAFDLGTNSGISVLSKGVIDCQLVECINRKGRKHKPDDHPGYRYQQFADYLDHFFQQYQVGCVFYEEAGTFRNVTTARVPYGMRALLLAAASRAQVPVVGVHVQTLKKYATGSARADKSEIIAYAARRFGIVESAINHDQADSLALLSYGISTTYGREVLC